MQDIRFDDGAAYERYMGVWSQRVGTAFLEWLSPPHGGAWLDVGCGNGAFTALAMQTCAPGSIHGIDPSPEQLAYARTRLAREGAVFHRADAMALPFESGRFDVAVMPLVIFFVPEPARGVAEMARVVRPGGQVAAYAWDLEGGGFPYELVGESLRAMGIEVPRPPSADAARMESLESLWRDGGMASVETCRLSAQRVYDNFDDYWTTILGAPSAGRQIAGLSTAQRDEFQQRLRDGLVFDAAGRITCHAHAHAVKGIR